MCYEAPHYLGAVKSTQQAVHFLEYFIEQICVVKVDFRG